MENNVYIFFCGSAGLNMFFHAKKQGLPSCVKKIRHLDSFICTTAFYAHNNEGIEEAVRIGKETIEEYYTVIPWRGEMAARESRDKIRTLLTGCNTLLLVGGLGGGFGSGASPTIAKIARRMGIRVVAFFWMPFPFEGKRRATRAHFYQKRLEDLCDTCFFYDRSMLGYCTVSNCFDLADNVVVRGIMDFLATLQAL